nr:unnamed protein product [Digitaria exilis]
MRGTARGGLQHVGNGRGRREECWVACPESQVVAKRKGRQAEAKGESRGGVKELRGWVENSVEQVAGERTEAGGHQHAAGGAEQGERGDSRRATEAAGDKEVGMKLVDLGRLPLRGAGAGAWRRRRRGGDLAARGEAVVVVEPRAAAGSGAGLHEPAPDAAPLPVRRLLPGLPGAGEGERPLLLAEGVRPHTPVAW